MLVILFCIVLLILLVSWAKVNPFLAFLLVSIAAGLMLGIPLIKYPALYKKAWAIF
jgi:Gnt-I system high-affinity gluconate transporter